MFFNLFMNFFSKLFKKILKKNVKSFLSVAAVSRVSTGRVNRWAAAEARVAAISRSTISRSYSLFFFTRMLQNTKRKRN